MNKANQSLILGSLACFIVVFLGGFAFLYRQINVQLNDTKSELQQVKTERNNLQQQVTEQQQQMKSLEAEITKLDGILKGNNSEIERQRQEIKVWKQQTETLASCLGGVMNAIDLANQENPEALNTLEAVADKCQESAAIVQEMEK